MQLRTVISFWYYKNHWDQSSRYTGFYPKENCSQYVTLPWKSVGQRFFEYPSKYEKELTHFIFDSPFISMVSIILKKNAEKIWREVGYANSIPLIKIRNAAYDIDGIINSSDSCRNQ